MNFQKMGLIRDNLEEIELCEQEIINCLRKKKDRTQFSVKEDYTIREMMSNIKDKSQQVLDLYQTKSEQIEEEVSLASKTTLDVFVNQCLNEYDNNTSNTNISQSSNSIPKITDTLMIDNKYNSSFSVDEHHGRCLDLYSLFTTAQNSNTCSSKDYFSFIRDFDNLTEHLNTQNDNNIKKSHKLLSAVNDYLKSFHQKVYPLVDHNCIILKIEHAVFQSKNNEDLFTSTADNNNKKNELYCETCCQQFNNHNTYMHHFEGKKHKRHINNPISNSDPGTSNELTHKNKLEEEKVRFREWTTLLQDKISNTLNYIRLKMTQLDMDNKESDSENELDEDKDENGDKKNRKKFEKKIPIGWDGKPIPMWLYKQQGLGVEYVCEICGNHTYFGRRAYERHFSEWRHSYGLKCLKIINSKHFNDITRINDALILHKKITNNSKHNIS